MRFLADMSHMGRYVKSVTDTSLLNKSLNQLRDELGNYKKIVEKNNRELAKVNSEIDRNREKEIQELQDEIKNLENQNRWVKNEDPALKVNSDHMLKKLNIL